MPDETTICRFRYLLEEHDLWRQMFEAIHRYLERQGIKVSKGTIVDATQGRYSFWYRERHHPPSVAFMMAAEEIKTQ